jgi:hypothetical protein
MQNLLQPTLAQTPSEIATVDVPWGAAVFLWGGKTHCALIATPNVDNANRTQKKGKS